MRIITRTVLILSLVSMLADVASEMLYPIIPVYLKEIGFSVFFIGVLEGVVGFMAGISKGYFGKWSDEVGVRLPFIKAGYFLGAISKPLMAVFTFPVWIFFVRTIDRLGKGLRSAPRDALLSTEATLATKARVFGFHRGMDTLGAAIGPIIALLFLYFNPGNYTALFYYAFIPGLLSVLLIFLLKEKKQPPALLKKGGFFSFFNYWKIAPLDFKKTVPAFLLFALFNSSDIFLLLLTKEVVSGTTISFLSMQWNSDAITIAAYVFYNIVYAAAAYPLGAIADKLGHKVTIIGGFVIYALVYIGFASMPSLPILFFLFILYGLYAAATEGVIKAWITNLTHQNNTATAVGFYTSCESIATMAASIIGGALWTYAGASYTFLLPAIVAVLVAAYLVYSAPNKSVG
jgi:MFS family permease